ncbi:hypothetical protein D3C71_826630 [compost metagenome]
MPVPTRAHFDAALCRLARLADVDTMERAATALSNGDTDERRRIASKLVAEFRAAARAAATSKEVQLILGDPAIDAAYRILTGRARQISRQEAQEKAVTRFLGSLILPDRPEAPPVMKGELVDALDLVAPAGFKWCVIVLGALQEYHSGTQATEGWAKAREQIAQLERDIRQGAVALKVLTQMAIEFHPPRLGALCMTPKNEMAEAAERRALASMGNRIKNLRSILPPPLRQGETAPVRLLVYRLSAANRYLFRKHGASAIEELLHAEGLRPLDRRNIERAIRAQEPFFPRAAGVEYRRILLSFRDLSAWAEI